MELIKFIEKCFRKTTRQPRLQTTCLIEGVGRLIILILNLKFMFEKKTNMYASNAFPKSMLFRHTEFCENNIFNNI